PPQPAHFETPVFELQTISDAPAAISDDRRRGCAHLRVLERIEQRTPPVAIQSQMRIGVYDDAPARLACTEISRGGDAVAFYAIQPDPAALHSQPLHRTIGGRVIDHDDFASGGESIVQVLDGPAQLPAFVAADDNDANVGSHSPQARRSPSARPLKKSEPLRP